MTITTNGVTCQKCEQAGLEWAQSVKGNWYLGTPYIHTFEDGNQTVTHYAAHKCNPTSEQLARFEAMQEAKAQERKAKFEAMDAAIKAKEAEDAKLRQVTGEVGEVVELTGKVTMATSIDTQFGRSRLIVIVTEDYQVAKIFTTANWAWSVDFDDVITISGTIKSFDTYDNKPQTTIARPKRLDI